MTAYFPWEAEILLWIQNNLRNPVLDPVMKTITHLGDGGAVWILLTLVLLIFPKTRRAGMFSAMAMIGSLLINNIVLKNLFARTRPYELIEGLKLIISPAWDYSFPSGHTGTSIASAVSMAPELPRRWAVLLLILAVVIAFSRLYVGVHFPTDVLGGLVTGLAAAWTARRLLPFAEAAWRKRTEREC